MTIGRGTRVLFVCDFPPGFTGGQYRTVGVGGTEALVVLMAEELARRGAAVTVGTRAASGEAANGVTYAALEASCVGMAPDLTVLVKRWSDAVPVSSGMRVFLAPDVHVNPDAQVHRCREWCDVAVTGSDFQREAIERAIGPGKLVTLGWPVEVSAYRDAPADRENVLIYCSVPDRGLFYLKDLFPRIRWHVPDARLVITSDFSLWGLNPARAAFERFFDQQESVEYLGHLDRPSLVAAQRRAKVMAYPCNFPEGFCLSAAECLAAGTVPVTTRGFALTTTVGGAGVLVHGRPRGWLYQRRFVKAVVRLLTDDTYWRGLSAAGRARAEARFAPERIVDDFVRLAEAASGAERQ